MNWIKVTERLPPANGIESWMGGDASDPVICLFADDPDHFDNPGPHVRCCILIRYDEDSWDWFDQIDRMGGLDRCDSHGCPAPIAWMECPPIGI